MRLLIDAQLPPAICGWFAEQDIAAVHVDATLGIGATDRIIAGYVEENELILLTKDDDFLLRYPPRRSWLVWLRCGNISNRGLRIWLASRWPLAWRRVQDGDRIVEVQ